MKKVKKPLPTICPVCWTIVDNINEHYVKKSSEQIEGHWSCYEEAIKKKYE